MPPPVGSIENIPLYPSQVTSQNLEAPYVVYNIQTKYVWNPGVISMPPGGPSTIPGSRRSAEIVQVHQPVGYKVVSFIAVRKMAQPQVPSPDPVDADNETLIWSEFVTESPALDANFGDHIYAISGVYVYALSKPVYPTDLPGMPMGKVDYDQTAAPVNTFSSLNFRPDLLSPPPVSP